MFHGIPTYMWHLSTCKKHKQILKYYNPSESKIRRHCWVTVQVRAMLGTSHVESSIEWKGSIRIANCSSKNLQPKIKHVCKIADVETSLLIRYISNTPAFSLMSLHPRPSSLPISRAERHGSTPGCGFNLLTFRHVHFHLDKKR